MYTIEKNIPVPARARRSGSKYPLDSMQPTDSFFVPDEEGVSTEKLLARVEGAVGMHRMRLKKNGQPSPSFAVRAVDGGVRVWLID